MLKCLKNAGLLFLYLLLYLFSSSLISSVVVVTGIPPIYLHVLAIAGLLLLGLVWYLYWKTYRREQIEVSGAQSWMKNPVTPIVLFVGLWIVQLLFPTGNSNNQNAVIQFISAYPFYAFLQVVIFAPILEEYIFRGFVANLFFPRMKGTLGFFGFAGVSGVLFSLVHMPNSFVFFLIYFSMGFLLAWLYATKLDLRYSIALHALNNLISFVMIIMIL